MAGALLPEVDLTVLLELALLLDFTAEEPRVVCLHRVREEGAQLGPALAADGVRDAEDDRP